MKKSRHFIGLPVVDLSTGLKIGAVEALTINPERGRIDFLLLDRDKWYGELRAIPYSSIFGIGENAVTIEKSDAIHKVSENQELIAYLEMGIKVLKAKVMTKMGQYVGIVSEFLIEEDTGIIDCCLVLSQNGRQVTISGDKVLTYGTSSLIIEEDYSDGSSNEVEKEELCVLEEMGFDHGNDSTDLLDAFEARQLRSLIGKRTAKTIKGDDLQIIIDKGEVITEEVIEKALSVDKYVELVMNISAEDND